MAYISCITVNGRPILPPLMTEEKISEMQRYRNMAKEVEKKLNKMKVLRETKTEVTECPMQAVEDNVVREDIDDKMCLEDGSQPQDLTEITRTMNQLNLIKGDTVVNSPKKSRDGSTDVELDSTVKPDDENNNSSTDFSAMNGNDHSTMNGNFNSTMNGNFNSTMNGNFNSTMNGNFNSTMNGNFHSTHDSVPTTWTGTAIPATNGNFHSTHESVTNIWTDWEDEPDDVISSPPPIVVEGIGENENPEATETTNSTPRSPKSKSENDSSPSLASTDLGKYMAPSPEVFSENTTTNLKTNPPNSSRTESSSTCSTVIASARFTPQPCKTSEGENIETTPSSDYSADTSMTDEKNSPRKKHVRRSSYTLECPSPALAAQVHFYEDHGIRFPQDMCSIRRESFTETVSEIDRSKQEHLERYLENISQMSKAQEVLDYHSLFLSNNVNPKEFDDEVEVKVLSEHFENLKRKLEEEHKMQMEMLIKRQREEQMQLKNDILVAELKAKLVKKSEKKDYRQPSLKIKPYIPPKSVQFDEVKMKPKFDRVSAAVKGYLTRRLLKTERVQDIIKTIRDTLEFALNFQQETPIKTGRVTPAEAHFHQRILQQLTSSCYEFHDVFFQLPISEQMKYISQDRALQQEKIAREEKANENILKRNLSSATLKALERKRAKLQNSYNKKSSIKERSKSALPWSLPSRKSKINSESARLSSPLKNSFRPRTTSPRYHTRPTSRLSLERINRNPRRNISAAFPPEPKNLSGGRTFRVSRLSPRSVLTYRGSKN